MTLQLSSWSKLFVLGVGGRSFVGTSESRPQSVLTNYISNEGVIDSIVPGLVKNLLQPNIFEWSSLKWHYNFAA
jgi:hypothetical protein